MDVKLFIGVLMAWISFVVGPRPLTDGSVQSLLAEVQQILDREDQSPKEVVQVLNGNRGMWISLMIMCHFIVQDTSQSPAHRQACEYLRALDCYVGREMMEASGLESDEEVQDWLLGVRELYSSTSDKIELDFDSDKITICLPHIEQKQSHRAGKKQQTMFYTISFFVSDFGRAGGERETTLLESIASIAQKYEEKVAKAFEKKLAKNFGKKVKQIWPFIKWTCEQVEIEGLRLDYKIMIDKLTAATVEKAAGNVSEVESIRENAHEKLSPREMAEAIEIGVMQNLRPAVEQSLQQWKGDDGKGDTKSYVDGFIKDATKHFRNAMARKFLSKAPETPEVLNDKVVIQDATPTADVRYMCNAIRRQMKD